MPDPSSTTTAATPTQPTAVGLPDFGSPTGGAGATSAIGLLSDVSLQVRIELGRTKMLVEDVLKLNPDSVVELDKAAGDPVDIYVNGRRIARGEVLVLNENFCVRVSEILEPLDA
jgi:flagellar motor switch protein FliN/FliY